MVNRVVTGAHYGLGSWLAQRITAVVIVIYTLIVLVMFMTGRPLSYGVLKDLFTQGWMRVATLMFAIAVAWHAWVGVRDIVMDYARPESLRLSLHVLTILLLLGYIGWTVQILWR
ncbi:MAG TPA: succinate dehydrogenase, hydrophobic membrane anchor protein [Burkholderiales bacterium]|nr:succinate dehydrogenase, hydrophobic membrane anchor protein [Burkholderiales bacterium]